MGDERQFLLAVGVSRYEELGADVQLPSVEQDVQRIVDLFCRQLGYERVGDELGDSPRAAHLRTVLSEWLTSEDRRPSDRVVVYYSGHGETGSDGRHYLLARDFDGRNYVGRALATEDIGRMLAGTPLRHVLVMLDTCYSGEGISDLGALQHVIESSRHEADEPGAAMYLVAASRRREPAHQGVFSRLFADAVHALPHGGRTQPHLDPVAVIGAVNDKLQTEFPGQHARLNVVGAEGGLSPLIPNPRYEPQLPMGLDVASARRLLKRPDLLAHWGPLARGVELDAQPGDFFEGRTAAMRALVQWLSQDAAGGPVRVVTGRPGSGKSALLARLAVLSDAQYRARVELRGAATGTVPPVGAIDVAVHARGKTVTDVASELAAEFGCDPTVPLVIEAAACRERPLVVLVDALDEALDPRALAREALRPLAASGTVKLLVGTRHNVLGTLAVPSEAVLDLDQPAWFDPGDIERYVEHTLIAAAPGGRTSPYAGSEGLARQVAREVAARAGSTFLIARLVARSFAERRDPIDVSDPSWAKCLPDTVGDAFEEWLDRFGADKPRARDLLRPLAFAQGAGLPWETLWPALATSIAGRSYGDSDVEWALEAVGALIIESRQQGRSVYRLFHEALATHLRPNNREAVIEKTIAETLESELRRADGAGNWQGAHPYVRTHLATHAARGGVLDHLLQDADYLIAADPPRLLRALPAADHTCVAPSRRAYRDVAHVLRDATASERAAYLEMASRRAGATVLADEVAQQYPSRPWATHWAHWRSSSEHFVAGRENGPVYAVAAGRVNGRAIAVSGGDSGTMQVWDLAAAQLDKPLTGHTDQVRAVAVGELDGHPIAVSGGQTVRVWDLVAGRQLGKPLTGHTGWVLAVAVGELDGRTIAVSGGEDGSVRVWDLVAGRQLGKPLTGHSDRVLAVAVGELDGRTIAVSGGEDGSVRVWDLAASTQLGKSLTGHFDGPVYTVAVGEFDGRTIVVSGGGDVTKGGTMRVWNLATRTQLGESLAGLLGAPLRAVAMGELDGRAIAVSGGEDGSVRVWDLQIRAIATPLAEPLTGHDDRVLAIGIGELDGRTIAVSGGEDGSVRVWDLAASTQLGEPLTRYSGGPVYAVGVGELDGRAIAVSGGEDPTLRVWNVANGTQLGEPLTGDVDGPVYAVGVGELDGDPIVVFGGKGRTVRVLELAARRRLRATFIVHHDVLSVAVGELDGRAIAVSGGDWGKVRVWGLAARRPLGEPLTGYVGTVLAVAVGELDGRAIAVSGGADRTVRIWDLSAGTPLGKPLTGHTSQVLAVAVGELDGQVIAVSGGADRTVRIWDLSAGTPLGKPLTGHTDKVLAVAVGELDGRAIAVSGGEDRTVRVWDSDGSHICVIDAGSRVAALALQSSAILVAANAGVMAFSLPVVSTSASSRTTFGI